MRRVETIGKRRLHRSKYEDVSTLLSFLRRPSLSRFQHAARAKAEPQSGSYRLTSLISCPCILSRPVPIEIGQLSIPGNNPDLDPALELLATTRKSSLETRREYTAEIFSSQTRGNGKIACSMNGCVLWTGNFLAISKRP